MKAPPYVTGTSPEKREEHLESTLREAEMALSLRHDGILQLREFFV